METENNEQETFLTNSVGITNGTFYVILKNNFEPKNLENMRHISFDKSQNLLSVYNGQYTKEEKGFLFSDRKIEDQQGVLIPFESIVRLMNDEGEMIWEP